MKPLNQKNMNYINKFIYTFFLFNFFICFSQDSKPMNKIKVDGISSVVGDFIILESDIDKVMIDMESQGISTRGVSKCQLLGKLMEDKLYAHHAVQDSLELSDSEISPSLRLKATSRNSLTILGFFLFNVYLPPLLLDPGS